MVKIETKAETQQVTRELLAVRLFRAFLAADEAGYQFSKGELLALQGVTRWPDARLLKAAEYYEKQTKR